MSVRASILGVLTMKPTYGHQILFEIERRLPHRRGVNPGQVYSTLGRLVASGHLASDSVSTENLPVYRLTDNGSAEALSWLRGTTHIDLMDWAEVKDAVLLCASLPQCSPDILISALREACRSSVESMNVSAQPHSAADTPARLSDEATRIHLESVLTWLDVVSAAISGGQLTSHALAGDRPGRGRRPKPAAAPA